MSDTLVLVHKKPQLGIGKQRLAARFGAELTVRAAEALLACALEDAATWPGPIVLAPANKKDCEWARRQASHFSSLSKVIPQIEGNLGQRLNALDKTLRGQGMERLTYIGSDAPGLTGQDYATARSHLDQNDAVLIPSVDGGVVLMASRLAWPDLAELPWSTDCLGTALTTLCRSALMTVSTLKNSYDIDQPEDFLQLAELLQTDRRPARKILHTLCNQIASTINNTPDCIHA